jgi:putative transposase
MDDRHLLAAVRYVSLNPVRARVVGRAEDWLWSSVQAHLSGQDDGLVAVRPVLDRVSDFRELVASDAEDPDFRAPESVGDDRQAAGPRGFRGRSRTAARAAHCAQSARPETFSQAGRTTGPLLKGE